VWRYGRTYPNGINDDVLSCVKHPSQFHCNFAFDGKRLQALLNVVPRESVLIIPNEAMQKQQQQAMDIIWDHIGGEREPLVEWHGNNGRQHMANTYMNISQDVRGKMQSYFNDDVKLLQTLVGRKFSW
jgi:hypothetical protein